ncbi:hypothetical protein ACWDUC_06225 [Streptomyces tricolor]
MSHELPDAIATVHAAGLQAEKPGTSLGLFDQSIWFAYRRASGPPFGLALVRGPVRVPAIGETITLWTQQVPLRVVDIESHYGLLHGLDPDDGQPHASIKVYVEPAARS